MDRHAIFVDAGYLLAGGADLICELSRAETTCNYEAAIHALIGEIKDHASTPLLRMYWYDGAPNLVPMKDHDTIAKLSNVKVRLGRLVSGGQKGVDSRIVRDLIILAQHRAIETAYLLSGDEDLREGVSEAQDAGVRVVLLGLPKSRRGKQSYALIAEADEHWVLPKEFWAPFFTPVVKASGTASTPEAVPLPPVSPVPLDEAALVEAAMAFAESLCAEANADGHGALRSSHPYLPHQVDIELMRSVSQTTGQSVKGDGAARLLIRQTVAEVVMACLISPPTS